MTRVVTAAVHNTDFLLWARDQIRRTGVDLRDPRAIAAGIRRYVAERITYVPDPAGIESITPPLTHQRALDHYGVVGGDCDDAATLSAALGRALGLRPVYTIESFDWGKPTAPTPYYDPQTGLWAYQHVFTTLLPAPGRGTWSLDVDTTRESRSLPPKVQRRFSVYV